MEGYGECAANASTGVEWMKPNTPLTHASTGREQTRSNAKRQRKCVCPPQAPPPPLWCCLTVPEDITEEDLVTTWAGAW